MCIFWKTCACSVGRVSADRNEIALIFLHSLPYEVMLFPCHCIFKMHVDIGILNRSIYVLRFFGNFCCCKRQNVTMRHMLE